MKTTLLALLASASVIGCATQQPKPDVIQLVRESEGHPEVQRAIIEKYLAEKAAGEARLRNMAIISSAAIQAGAAWYQSSPPTYNYYAPSPAVTYYNGYQQNSQMRELNHNLWGIRQELRYVR